MTERWQGWAARLDDPDLPPPVAASVARHGTAEERHALVNNRALSHDVLLTIITTWETDLAQGLLLNYDLPAEMLELLAQRHRIGEELVSGHPSASLDRKMRLPVGDLTGLALHRFFTAVRAGEGERRRLHEEIERDPTQTLAIAWEAVRPAASPA